MTTISKAAFTDVTKVMLPVPCRSCADAGRSVTLCQIDQFGSLYFLGKLTPTLRIDRAKRLVFVECRTCHTEVTLELVW